MKSWIVGVAIAALVMNGAPAWAQDPQTEGTLQRIDAPAHPDLGFAGMITSAVGIVLLIPNGYTYRILGDKYCVQEYSVDYGSCGPDPLTIKIGLATLGAGVAMTYFGYVRRKVVMEVVPTRTGIAATATVRWGGK